MLVYNTVASMTGYPVYMDLWYLMFAKVNFYLQIFIKQNGGSLKVPCRAHNPNHTDFDVKCKREDFSSVFIDTG